MSQRFALLIGVDVYRSDPDETLHAPTHDVSAWCRLLVRLGFDGVRVAASPAPVGVEPSRIVEVTAADTAAVDGGLDWLVERVATAGAGGLGVVFYCGHGDLRAGEGSALYLADHGAPGARGTVDLEQVRTTFAARAPQGRLLALVDTCRTVTAPLRLPPGGVGIERTWNTSAYPCVLVCAAGIGEQAYERRFDGRYHGVLTWALHTLIGQWATGGREGSTAYVAATPVVLAQRAGALIAALSPATEPQTPTVYGSAAALALPFLAAEPHGVEAEPICAPGHEWSAGTVGTIVSGGVTKGWFEESTDSPPILTLKFTDATPPTSANGYTFSVYTPPPALDTSSAKCTRTASGGASWTLTTLASPGTMPYDSTKKVALFISGNTWTWYRYHTSNTTCPSLHGSQTFTNQSTPTADGEHTFWWSSTDTVS